MKNIMWTEKYRPKILDDIVGLDVSVIKKAIENPMSMPHFLFISKCPGTGKTTICKAIQNELKSKDCLILNSSDERKLETIRGKIIDFASSMRSDNNIPRFIHMDEFDGMLTASQEALRFIMEKYNKNCKFLLTANSESKICDPIKSRCTIIRINELPREDIKNRLLYILEQENIPKENIEEEAIDKIIDIYYPDMRSMINKLQELSPNILLEKVKTQTEVEDKYYELLKEGNIYTVRKFVIENNLDPHTLLIRLIDNITNDEIIKEKERFNDRFVKLLYYIAEVDRAPAADKEIQLFAVGVKFIELFK